MLRKIRGNISLVAIVVTLSHFILPARAAENEKHSLDQQENKMTLSQCTSTNFSFKLFKKVLAEEKGNVMVSPFSAYAALSMTLNGAAGSTRKQMAASLGVSDEAIDALNKRNHEVFQLLNKNEKVQLEIANAIYSDASTPFKKSFIALCEKSYDAAAHSEDFANPAVLTQINNWCNEKTHGKIPKILDKLTKKEKMVLLNAIYFKGTWAKPFEKAATRDDQFDAEGQKTAIKMMHMQGFYQYHKGDNFQAISMPYSGDRQRMYIFLPNQGVSLPAFEAQLNADTWDQWRQKFSGTNINLSLPRFKVETSMLLNDALKAMGMSEAFEENKADFSNLIEGDWHAWISRVLQKTFMDVNEEGTEAAAVTVVAVAAAMSARMPERVIEFRVDRPFVVALVDNDSNEILFLGAISKP